jgi:DNA-binding winged helix-turn-helix (wHTH) protein
MMAMPGRRLRIVSGRFQGFFRLDSVTIQFGAFALNLGTRQLLDGKKEVHVSAKAYTLLALLVRERPNALSKELLQEQLWPDIFVAEANLSNLVGELRDALGDSRQRPAFIRTVHGFGYAFCGRAKVVSYTARDGAQEPRCWLEWGKRRFALGVGEHAIGRNADAEVRLEAVSVSRHHARLVVTEDGAVLEDCDSKNGTYRGHERVTAPVTLADGDQIRVGALCLTVRMASPSGSTHTHVQEGT